MADGACDKGKGVEGHSMPSFIRITLSSVNRKALENVTKKLVNSAKGENFKSTVLCLTQTAI